MQRKSLTLALAIAGTVGLGAANPIGHKPSNEPDAEFPPNRPLGRARIS